MAGGYKGLKPEDMEQLINLVNTKAQKIEGIINRLNGDVESTEWDGPDAQRFKDDWKSNLSKSLREVVRGLEEVSKAAKKELEQQRATSK